MTGNRLWILGASLAIAGIVVLGWLLGISPKLAEGDVAIASREAVEQQNAAQEAVLVGLKKQFEDLEGLKVELEDLQKQLPSNPEVEEFIGYVNDAAVLSGVVVSNIVAVEPTGYGATADGVAPPAAPPAEGSGTTPEGDPATPATPAAGTPSAVGADLTSFFSVGVTIQVEGSPEQVMAFSKLLQESERVFLDSQVEFTSGSQGILGGSVTGFLFVLGSTAAAG